MEQEPLKLAVIIGSTREGRFGPVIAKWFTDVIAQHPDFEVDVIDLAATPLPRTMSQEANADVIAFRARLADGDAFVVVTPEYNHSYPAPLKHAIDFAQDEFGRKPVAFVSYGGTSGGLRAVEHLRGVFAEMRSVVIRDGVVFPSWSLFDKGNELRDPSRHEVSAKLMLDDLYWWGTTLRDARYLDAA